MNLNREFSDKMNLDPMAGIGPAAWARQTPPVKVPTLANHQGEHRVVKVDHEQRKEQIARDPDRAFVPDSAMFEEREPMASTLIKFTIGISFVGLMFMAGS